MKRTSTLILLILFAMLVSGCSTVSTHGQYTLHRGETLRGNLVLTSGQATLEEAFLTMMEEEECSPTS